MRFLVLLLLVSAKPGAVNHEGDNLKALTTNLLKKAGVESKNGSVITASLAYEGINNGQNNRSRRFQEPLFKKLQEKRNRNHDINIHEKLEDETDSQPNPVPPKESGNSILTIQYLIPLIVGCLLVLICCIEMLIKAFVN